MRKYYKYLLVYGIFFMFLNNAEAITVSKDNVELKPGGNETVDVFVDAKTDISEVNFTLIYTTYDIPASFMVADGLTDNGGNSTKHNIVLREPKSGKILLGSIDITASTVAKVTGGTINIHTASAKTKSGETIELDSASINVKITEEEVNEPVEVDKNLLDGIESKIVKIDLKKDVFEYTVTVDEDILELDLDPKAIDNDVKVEVSSQKIEELKDNKITITASKGDIQSVYTINVEVKENSIIEIDNREFKEDNKYKSKWEALILIVVCSAILSVILTKKRSKKRRRKKKKVE